MSVTPQQIHAAKLVQDAAAQDTNQAIRLVAGPGSGKSFVIEGRVAWLIQGRNVPPASIIAVSFTRSAAKDLRDRIYEFGAKNGITNINEVRVSTLHSLALRILRNTGNLTQYPADPMILDDWELDNVFDAEFSESISVTPSRGGDIRRNHEAFWSTGSWTPPNLPVVDPPISQQEKTSFNNFYSLTTQVYSCVLPGEVIRTCVDNILRGHIDPVAVLGVEYIIVDEAQDLNSCDFEFIDALVARGVNVFICGDDDQSIYGFRYAFPEGIQQFNVKYPFSSNHVLNDCFRCTSDILAAAKSVINSYPDPRRIPKDLASVYLASTPPNMGVMMGRRFRNPNDEVSYIANSCAILIAGGVSPADILILVGNKRVLLGPVTSALSDIGVPYDSNQRDQFKDSRYGRFIISILRILSDDSDYVAHRVLLAMPRGVGLKTVLGIKEKIILNNLNFRDIFYNVIPTGVFSNRESSVINRAVSNLQFIQNWSIDDCLGDRVVDIANLVGSNFLDIERDEWLTVSASLPSAMKLSELKEFLQTDSEITRDEIITRIDERNQGAVGVDGIVKKVRIMSFHSSKGLSAKVVFIPGLEEGVFPTQNAVHLPGRILENARLLYVAITRAKAACIISHSEYRTVNGIRKPMVVSRFAGSTGVVFNTETALCITPTEVANVSAAIRDL